MRWPIVVACAFMLGACASIAGLDPVDSANATGDVSPDGGDGGLSSASSSSSGAPSSASSTSGTAPVDAGQDSSFQPPANGECENKDDCDDKKVCNQLKECVNRCTAKDEEGCSVINQDDCCVGLACFVTDNDPVTTRCVRPPTFP